MWLIHGFVVVESEVRCLLPQWKDSHRGGGIIFEMWSSVVGEEKEIQVPFSQGRVEHNNNKL